MENKKINSKMIVIVMLIAMFLNLAKGQEVNFDFDMKNKVEKNFFELQSDIKPVIPAVSSATIISNKRIKEVNNSILNSIRYCKKNNISPTVTDGLKKLLVYGNNEEKLSFLNSKDKFVIPQRLSSFETPDITNFLGISKGQIQVCEQTNCRDEEVCGWKEVCNLVTKLVCGGVGGGIGGVAGGVTSAGCMYVTEKVCEKVKDCQTIQKCDTVCHWEDDHNIQPGQCVTNSHGQTVCQ